MRMIEKSIYYLTESYFSVNAKTKQKLLLFAVFFIVLVNILLYENSDSKIEPRPNPISETTKPPETSISLIPPIQFSSCEQFLSSLNLSFPFVIFDERVIYQIEKDDCKIMPNGKIKIGIDVTHPENLLILADARFDVIFFTNETKNDYLSLRDENRRRIIPKIFNQKNFENITIPSRFEQFYEMWKRSTFIECLDLSINGEGEARLLNVTEAIETLAKLRDEILAFGIYPLLAGETLLGWYRECGLSYNTTGLDFMIHSEDYKPELADNFRSDGSSFSHFKILRQSGKPEDSLEMSVQLKTGYDVPINIKLLSEEKLENDHPFCAGQLFGHIFWMSCSPEKVLTLEYGKRWSEG